MFYHIGELMGSVYGLIDDNNPVPPNARVFSTEEELDEFLAIDIRRISTEIENIARDQDSAPEPQR